MRGGLAGPLSPRPRTGVRSVVHRGHTPSRASQLLAAPRRANCRARPGAGRGRAGSAGGDRTTDDASPRPLGRVRNVQTTERVADPARGARARADRVPGRVGRTVSFYEESNVAECPYRVRKMGRAYNVYYGAYCGRAARNVKYTSMSAVASR